MLTEKLLIDFCQELGGIAESNCHYTAGLARLIEQQGQAVGNMTVIGLLKLSREYTKTFNEIHGGNHVR